MSVAEQFVGLSKKKAQDVAEKMNLIFRLIRNDSEQFFSYPEDTRNDRICVELDSGQITKATIQ